MAPSVAPVGGRAMTGDLRAALLQLASGPRGITTAEACEATGAPHQTVSAWLAQLAGSGALARSPLRRPNERGRPMRVYVRGQVGHPKPEAITREMRVLVAETCRRWTAEQCDAALVAAHRVATQTARKLTLVDGDDGSRCDRLRGGGEK